jgi:hypothetical protein
MNQEFLPECETETKVLKRESRPTGSGLSVISKQLGSLTLTVAVLVVFFVVVIALAALFLLLAGLPRLTALPVLPLSSLTRLTALLALIGLDRVTLALRLTALLTLFLRIFIFCHKYSSNPKYEPPRTPENL